MRRNVLLVLGVLLFGTALWAGTSTAVVQAQDEVRSDRCDVYAVEKFDFDQDGDFDADDVGAFKGYWSSPLCQRGECDAPLSLDTNEDGLLSEADVLYLMRHFKHCVLFPSQR